MIKRCLSTNFRKLNFRGHTHRHEFQFSAQLAREAAEKQNVRIIPMETFEAENCIPGYTTHYRCLGSKSMRATTVRTGT